MPMVHRSLPAGTHVCRRCRLDIASWDPDSAPVLYMIRPTLLVVSAGEPQGFPALIALAMSHA